MTPRLFGLRLLMNALFAVASAPAATASPGSLCRAPLFEAIELAPSEPQGTPLRVSHLMRMALPQPLERLSFEPDGIAARWQDGSRLMLQLDDASLAHLHNGLTDKAGPLWQGMVSGSSAQGCELLKHFPFDQQDYRVRFTRGSVAVYAFGKGRTHEFVLIHANKPDKVVRGLASQLDRPAFFSLIATIQSPEQE